MICELFLPGNKRGTDLKIRPINRPKSEKIKNHIIHKGAEKVNKIPDNLRILPTKPFKKQLKKLLITHNVWEPDDPDFDDAL